MQDIINEQQINKELTKSKKATEKKIIAVLEKSKNLKGLSLSDTAALLHVDNQVLENRIIETAKHVKNNIFGKRIKIFAPLYISNVCINNCVYCGFRKDNKLLERKTLKDDEIREETEILKELFHKRICLVYGESVTVKQIVNHIKMVTDVFDDDCEINVNFAPVSKKYYTELSKKTKDNNCFATYRIFQETYHKQTYEEVHPKNTPKGNYDFRVNTFNRALESGIHDIGLGVLFEVLCLLQHSTYLIKKYGHGPRSISVPRLEPANEAPFSLDPPAPLSTREFKKVVAVLRLAIPWTEIILTTRETPEVRAELAGIVSEMSAGSRTTVGGYRKMKYDESTEQFFLGDTRPVSEVVKMIVELGYLPSFCSACYKKDRTNKKFFKKVKDCKMKDICTKNALLTFKEYLNKI